MNFVRLASLTSVILAAGIGCSSGDDDANKSSGGMSGTGATAGQTAGGTAGSGGSSGTATTAGTGGSTGGAGGATAGSAGMSSGGTSGTASGGAGTGAGGAGATGAGAGGMATGGMGGGGLDPDTFFSPNLNGLYYELRTYNGTDPGGGMYWLTEMAGDACPTGADWASSGITRTKDFTAKGTAGQKYTVNFQVRGAMALRCVSGGTPSGMMGDAMGTKNNTFYVGGTQFMDSPLNTWQFDVTPAVTGEAANTYFLNGIPSSSNQCDAKVVYDVGYTAKVVVAGDSKITLSAHSSDCKVPQNCGADPTGAGGCKPRTIDMTGVEVHASPMQPVADVFDPVMLYPQWIVIDITSITQN